MPKYKKFVFVIDGFTPLTLPISRLADYLKKLGTLIGADGHFTAVVEGNSTELISLVPIPQVPVVREKIIKAQKGQGRPEDVNAFRGLRDMVYEDKTAGRFREEDKKILELPRIVTQQFGPVTQHGTLEGVVIKLGGRDTSVPVHIQDGKNYYKCWTSRPKAKELAKYLFGAPIRVIGKGKWLRNLDGEWILDQFQIADYEELDNGTLTEVVEQFRAVPNSGWDEIDDPMSELARIREGHDKVN